MFNKIFILLVCLSLNVSLTKTQNLCCGYDVVPTTVIPSKITFISPPGNNTIAFSSNGCLAIGYGDASVKIFTSSNQVTCAYNTLATTIPAVASDAQVNTLAFSQNGCLAVGYYGGSVKVFAPIDAKACTYNTTPKITIAGSIPVQSIAFSQKGCLAVGYLTSVEIFAPIDLAQCSYNTTPTTIISTPPLSLTVALAFTQNGCLAGTFTDGSVHIFPPLNQSSCTYNSTASTIILNQGAGPSYALAISPSGCLAVGFFSGLIKIYNPLDLNNCIYSTTPSTALSTNVSPVLAFTRTNCLAVAQADGLIYTFSPINVCTYDTTPTTTIPSSLGPGSIAISPNNCLAVQNAGSGDVRIFKPIVPFPLVINAKATPNCPHRRVTISGTVTDTQGNSVSGVTVIISEGTKVLATTTTNAQGTFRVKISFKDSQSHKITIQACSSTQKIPVIGKCCCGG